MNKRYIYTGETCEINGVVFTLYQDGKTGLSYWFLYDPNQTGINNIRYSYEEVKLNGRE